MNRGPLFRPDYKPKFSGHQTFPMRYGWLKKAYDRVIETEDDDSGNKLLCWGEDAIARYGVGKNMVASIRHWANVTGIIDEPSGTNEVVSTKFGKTLHKLDPYLEHPNSLWLIHWKLATAWKNKTTWFWAYSHYPAVIFEREQLIARLERLVKEQEWTNVAHTTLKKDVACFVRTYSAQHTSVSSGRDDSFESPLTELGLIRPVSKRDEFRFVRGQKSTLGNGAFVYALLEFWLENSVASTLSFEAIAHGPGSPGRAFLLDENDVVDRLSAIDDLTNGGLRWSETAGLKQVVRSPDFSMNSDSFLQFFKRDYYNSSHGKVAEWP